MKKQITLLSIIFYGLINISCFWDHDTLEMERMKFPSVLELISGKFIRHSPQFYYWRIYHRENMIDKFPDSLNYYDDLAVAYSKVGNDLKAIEIITQKDKIKPNLYTTHANLGTFHLHHGNIKKGIKHIEKALKINPNAHFGREKYQLLLAKYLQSKIENNKIPLPLAYKWKDYGYPDEKIDNFTTFLENNSAFNSRKISDVENAVRGVLGMMKFGNFDSPILLEILGDLLYQNGKRKSSRLLAARAYLKASMQVTNKKAKELYYKKTELTLLYQTASSNHKMTYVRFDELQKYLQEEIAIGDQYFEKIRQKEIQWIKDDINPEVEFSKYYYENPKLKKRIHVGVKDEHDGLMFYDNPSSNKKILALFPQEAISLDSLAIQAVRSHYLNYTKNINTEASINNKNGINLKSNRRHNYILTIAIPILIISFLFYRKRKKYST